MTGGIFSPGGPDLHAFSVQWDRFLGGIEFVVTGPVSWRSKKQSSVALSTAEAEYMALASAGQDRRPYGCNYLLLSYMAVRWKSLLFLKNPQFHRRAKHLESSFISSEN